MGAFNVLNYFITLTGPDARGATSPAGFAKQSAKIVTAISALDADVVTLMEIEDTDSTGCQPGNADGALADLVGKLNAAAGCGQVGLRPAARRALRGRPGRHPQRDHLPQGRRPAGRRPGRSGGRGRVVQRPRAERADLRQGRRPVHGRRQPLQVQERPARRRDDNVDTGDGQGEWNGDRTRQAASLAAFVDDLKASTGDHDVLLLGDFNAYTQEDPIEVLRDAGFTDLGSAARRGSLQLRVRRAVGLARPRASAPQPLTAKVTDVAHWNINSVESFAYQYDGDPALYAPNPFRSSDHDPLVLGIDLEERCNGLLPTIKGTNAAETLTGTNKNDVIMGLGGNDRITGANGNDVICGGAGDDVVDGGNGNDVLLGGFGNDTVTGANGDDVLIGGPGVDVLNGGRGSNSITQDGAES